MNFLHYLSAPDKKQVFLLWFEISYVTFLEVMNYRMFHCLNSYTCSLIKKSDITNDKS